MIVLPLLYFLSLGAYLLYKSRRWGLDVAAVSLLVAVSVFAIFIDVLDLYPNYGTNRASYNLFTIILFCAQWTLVLWPVSVISNRKLHPIDPVKLPMVKLLATGVVVSSLLMIYLYKDNIMDAMIMDVADAYAKHSLGFDDGIETNMLLLLPQILINTPFPTIALFLFFYLAIFSKTNPVLMVGLLLASIVQAVIGIVQAGRSALIYWLFEFYLLFCYFYPYFSAKAKRLLVTVAAVLGSAIMSMLVYVTIARFEEGTGKERDPLESAYAYAGQHINNFSTMIVEGADSPMQLDRIFPLFSKYALGQQFDLNDHYLRTSSTVRADVNVFDTFGAEIYLDLGWFGYIAFFILWIILSLVVQSYWKETTLSRTLLVCVLIAFYTHGLFAWPFVGHYTTFAFFLLAVMYYLFNFRFKI